MTKKIVLIDDDKQTMPFYIQALEIAQYKVTHLTNTNSALDIIDNKIFTVDLWIIDITMPTGNYNTAKTENGTLTGLYLALDIKKAYPKNPIILFSASPLPPVTKKAHALAKQISKCSYISKSMYPPLKLVEYVDYFFEKGCFKNGALRKFYDSIILEPNFSGIGVDLKKLTD